MWHDEEDEFGEILPRLLELLLYDWWQGGTFEIAGNWQWHLNLGSQSFKS